MKKKSHLFRHIILFIISAIFLLSFSYYIYTTYSNIEMSSEYDISKISTSNNSVSTTTNLDISNMLEDVSNCVVGISKIKSHSTSIFSTSSLNDLGISNFSNKSLTILIKASIPSWVVLNSNPIFLAKLAYFSSAIKCSYLGNETNLVGYIELYLIT